MNREDVLSTQLSHLSDPNPARRRQAVLALRAMLCDPSTEVELRDQILIALREVMQCDEDEGVAGYAGFASEFARQHRIESE